MITVYTNVGRVFDFVTNHTLRFSQTTSKQKKTFGSGALEKIYN